MAASRERRSHATSDMETPDRDEIEEELDRVAEEEVEDRAEGGVEGLRRIA